MDDADHDHLRSLLHPGQLPGGRRLDPRDRNAIAAALEEIHRLRRRVAALEENRNNVRSLSHELTRLIQDT